RKWSVFGDQGNHGTDLIVAVLSRVKQLNQARTAVPQHDAFPRLLDEWNGSPLGRAMGVEEDPIGLPVGSNVTDSRQGGFGSVGSPSVEAVVKLVERGFRMLMFELGPVDFGPGSSKQLRVVHFQGGIILEPLFKLREPALSEKVRDFLLHGGRLQPRFFDHAVPRFASS